MRFELKNIQSLTPGDPQGYLEYNPRDPECFCLSLKLVVKAVEKPGEAFIDIEICSPRWLLENFDPSISRRARHYMVVEKYDLQHIQEFIKNSVAGCEAENWEDAAFKISRPGSLGFGIRRQTG